MTMIAEHDAEDSARENHRQGDRWSATKRGWSNSGSVKSAVVGSTCAISAQCLNTMSPCPTLYAIKCSSVVGTSRSVAMSARWTRDQIRWHHEAVLGGCA